MSKTVFKNTFHYGVLQLLSYSMPLVLVPYISRTIGLERYGITEFSIEIALFFGAILLFGYDFTMSKKLSQNRTDALYVNALFWEVFYSRVLLSAIILPLFVGIGLFFLSELFSLEIIAYSALFVASRMFSSWWFFQGLEKIKWIAWGNFMTKLVVLGLVLFLVRDQDEYPLVVLGYALSQFSVNVLAWLILIKMEKLKAIAFVFKRCMLLIKASFFVFLNEFSIIGFAALNLLMVKEFLSPKALGIYVSAMKIVVISQNLIIQSVSKSLFPNLSYALLQDRSHYLSQLKKFRNYLGIFLLFLGIGVLLLREQIVFILYGADYSEVSDYLLYAAFLPFFMGMTNIHGWQGLYVIGKEKTMASITLAIGMTSLFLLVLILPKYGVAGVLVVRNVHEFLLMLLTAIFFHKKWKKEGF